MSIRGHLGGGKRELRVRQEDAPVVRGDGPVLEGKASVEEAQLAAVRKALQRGEVYGRVADYDPVLRSVCRLDREGEPL